MGVRRTATECSFKRKKTSRNFCRPLVFRLGSVIGQLCVCVCVCLHTSCGSFYDCASSVDTVKSFCLGKHHIEPLQFHASWYLSFVVIVSEHTVVYLHGGVFSPTTTLIFHLIGGHLSTTAAHEVWRAGILTCGSCHQERSARPHPHRVLLSSKNC